MRIPPVLVFLVALFFGSSLAPAADSNRPNLLFCIADDWGWPHAGAYGDPAVSTPNFDRIAEAGVLFENAYVSSPSCTPSRNALLTGQWHWRLGPGANLWSTLNQDLSTYPQMLREAGYHTGSWRKSWGPGRLDGKWKEAEGHPAGKVYPKGFAAFLEARPEGAPFCFWLGASDPHRSYKLNSGRESGIDLAKIELFPHYPDVETIRSDVADYYFEVQRFDSDVGKALALLDELGEADNTIVVITGDHGMPFPRCKGNLYDCGARVPLALRWPARIPSGQKLDGFASLTDLAPTFLAAAGVAAHADMTGRNLLPAIERDGSGELRPFILTGKERHVPSQEAPDLGGTPMRAIRDHEFLLIRNFSPDRWPAGTPNWKKAAFPNTWIGDCDNGPTKTWMVEHRDDDDAHRRGYELSFGKRPAIELFDLKKDPDQLVNVANDPAYAGARARLEEKLKAELAKGGDPRMSGEGNDFFDRHPYLGGGPKHPDAASGKKKKN